MQPVSGQLAKTQRAARRAEARRRIRDTAVNLIVEAGTAQQAAGGSFVAARFDPTHVAGDTGLAQVHFTWPSNETGGILQSGPVAKSEHGPSLTSLCDMTCPLPAAMGVAPQPGRAAAPSASLAGQHAQQVAPPAVSPAGGGSSAVASQAAMVVPPLPCRAGPYFLHRSIRELRDNVLAQMADDGPAALAWLGVERSAEQAETVAQVGQALAEVSRRDVLLVDADFEDSVLSQRFGLERRAGLAEAFKESHPWRDLVVPTSLAKVHVLSSGQRISPSVYLKSSGDWKRLFDHLLTAYEFVIVDAGTALQPHVASLVQACRGAYLIVELDHTPADNLQHSLDELRRTGAAISGCVVRGVDEA
jgi:Mrp family chromosome partitioning ATPase